MGLADLTTTSVALALDEFDRLGRAQFLAKYGFGPARRYFIARNGQHYDSKAICGAAHGYLGPGSRPLAHDKFSGGEQTVVARLKDLGFAIHEANTSTSLTETPKVFVLTWNPTVFHIDDADLDATVSLTANSGVEAASWATGSRKSGIYPGDHVVLLRQQSERGIIAHGLATSEIWQGPHFNDDEADANYVDLIWTEWVATDDRLPVEDLRAIASRTNWNAIRGAGIKLPEEDAVALLAAWESMTGRHAGFMTGEEGGGDLPEGARTTVTVNRYERNRYGRTRCIEAHGTACAVCGIDFGRAYGGIAPGFIHVHHITPISSVGEEYRLNPLTDLVPVCPNCHAMLHHGVTEPRTIAELQALWRASI